MPTPMMQMATGVFLLNYNLHTDDDWKGNSGNGNGNNKGNSGNGNGNNKDNSGSGNNGKEKNYELIEYLNDVNREHAEVLVEQNINGRTDTSYIYGAEINGGFDRISLDRFDGSTGYYLYDARGSVSGITNEEGQVYQSYRYSVTGEITFGAPQYENEYTYNGESYNPNIESQYLRARYYCVVTATFLTEDSYLGNQTEPLTLNRYNYCVSSYLNYTDPSGNEVFEKATEHKDNTINNLSIKYTHQSGNGILGRIWKKPVGVSNIEIKYIDERILPIGGVTYAIDRGYSIEYYEYVYSLAVEKKSTEECVNDWGKKREVFLPDVVYGEVNGQKVEFFPKENWSTIGYGAYLTDVNKDEEGRYKIAVGPRILIPDYPDTGRLWAEDYEFEPNGELFRMTGFMEKEFLNKETQTGETAYIVSMPCYEGNIDSEEKWRMMHDQAYYVKDTGFYYFRVTKDQYDQLTGTYFRAEMEATHNIKKVRYTYDEVISDLE